MIGWIKTHRSKLAWEWFTDYKTSHLFEYILLCASHNEYKWRGTSFKAGQLPFGLTKASSESGLSVQSIRTSLVKLESTGEISRKSSNQGTVITVIKWKEYQIEDSTLTGESTSRITGKQQASNKQSTTTKNVNNEKNEKNNKNAFDLEKLYSYYPRKAGKASGIKKLQTEIKTQLQYDIILQAVINYKNLTASNNTEQTFIKQFSSWVNQKCWEDEIEIVKTQEEMETEMIRLLGGETYETRDTELHQ